MTDFETRLRESLRDRADDASGAVGLAAGARRRLRRRRTAIATAGAVAAVAVVLPFLLVDREQQDPEIATDPTSPSATATATSTATDDGLRTESWHDLTFEVPDDWGYGDTSTGCASRRPPEDSTPTVARPTDVTIRPDCLAASGYGLTVGPAATSAAYLVYDSGHVWQYETEGVDFAMHPDGAWLGLWYDDESVIVIATADRGLTEQILDSVGSLEGVDANGCPPTLGEADAGVSDGTDLTSLCRYDAGNGLEWSWRLSQQEADQLGDAVQAAPMRTAVYDCPTAKPISRTAWLKGGVHVATIVTEANCGGYTGVFLSGVVREITDEVRAAIERPQARNQ